MNLRKCRLAIKACDTLMSRSSLTSHPNLSRSQPLAICLMHFHAFPFCENEMISPILMRSNRLYCHPQADELVAQRLLVFDVDIGRMVV